MEYGWKTILHLINRWTGNLIKFASQGHFSTISLVFYVSQDTKQCSTLHNAHNWSLCSKQRCYFHNGYSHRLVLLFSINGSLVVTTRLVSILHFSWSVVLRSPEQPKAQENHTPGPWLYYIATMQVLVNPSLRTRVNNWRNPTRDPKSIRSSNQYDISI